MKITKFGHCCLLIEEKGLRILTDPGNLSTLQDNSKNIHAVLITHEHADHLHIDSLKKIIANQGDKGLVIFANKSVAKQLDQSSIPFYQLIEDGQKIDFKGLLIEGIEGKHEEIYKEYGQVQNTGFFINNKLFYPGDSFKDPNRSVEVLALPVAGPWCKIADAVNYALKVKPKIAFPVHDGALKVKGGNHKVPESFLTKNNIKFVIIEEGKSEEF
jgi:L-ascorbate metabolism protein UlaG (beta-lactamase superfamily)